MDRAPNAIEMGQYVFDIDFHPKKNLVAGGMVNGVVEVYEYTESQNQKVMELKYHADAARSLVFSSTGEALYSASSDQSIRGFDGSGNVEWTQLQAHDCAVNVVKEVEPNVLVSGDDLGGLKIWDTRQHRCVVAWKDHKDFISDLAIDASIEHLISTSGDGTLACYDLRQRKLDDRSDDLDDELLSIVIGKDGKKVFCGSQEGVICIFNWGEWGDYNERFPGHPESIDAMLKIDESTICTGSSDGIIRVIQMHPNKLLGVIGDHEDFPIEVMKFSNDKRLIGSTSHTNKVHFWDVAYLFEEEDDEDIDTISSAGEEENSKQNFQSLGQSHRSDFFDDL